MAAGLRVSARSWSSAEMKVGNLQDLELAILSDARHRFFQLRRRASADAKAGFLALGPVVQTQRPRGNQLPACPGLRSVRAEEYVDGSDGVLGVARMAFGRALQPDSSRPRLPLLVGLLLLAHGGVKPPDSDIDDDFVLVGELLLPLALDVHVGTRHPSGVQIQVLLDAVPSVLVKLAAGQRVEGRAGLHGEVGNNEAFVVERQMAVDGLGQDAVAVVEEEHQEEDDAYEDTELEARPHLHLHSQRSGLDREHGDTHDATGHGCGCRVRPGVSCVLGAVCYVLVSTCAVAMVRAPSDFRRQQGQL